MKNRSAAGTQRDGKKERRVKKVRSAGILTAVVIAALLAYGCINLMNMKTKVAEASKKEEQLQEEIESLQEEKASYQYALDNQDDPKVIEDVAREKLGLVMPDEMIFYDSGE